jgi:hypothetical protein
MFTVDDIQLPMRSQRFSDEQSWKETRLSFD